MILFFGIFVGRVGLATAGFGLGIPMIPLGIYFSYRGWRIYKNEHDTRTSKSDSNTNPIQEFLPLEKTNIGKFSIGTILIITGISASAYIIEIPIILLGVWFLYLSLKKQLRFAMRYIIKTKPTK